MVNWKERPPEQDRRLIADHESNRMQAQWSKGVEKHGPTFVGKPLNELGEELRDGLVYLNYAKRQLEEAVSLLQDTLKQPNIDPTLRTTIDKFVSDHIGAEPREDPFELLKQIRTIQGVRLVRQDPGVLEDSMLDKIELCLKQHGFVPANCIHGAQCCGSGPDCAPDRGVGDHSDSCGCGALESCDQSCMK